MATVHVCFYENAYQEPMEAGLNRTLPVSQRLRLPVNAPGRMLASARATSGASWAEVGDPFPSDPSGFEGGIAVVTVYGEAGDIEISIGRENNTDPATYDVMFDGSQRAYGLKKGDVVRVRDL